LKVNQWDYNHELCSLGLSQNTMHHSDFITLALFGRQGKKSMCAQWALLPLFLGSTVLFLSFPCCYLGHVTGFWLVKCKHK
jgi:hypothetical protein